ncbi:MAG: HIT domain-containing protein [Alphaproteobacteria bacterium]|nr:HIT domain-containing protein [Alphaproteobacteria bacterium]MCL2505108.1 HIT domain-containing protein [Alphaproteobacteria bacterium]
MNYDSENIFAKILRKEAPCTVVYEDDFVLAFNNIEPAAAIHFLVIPKGPYRDYVDFIKVADDSEIIGFYKGIHKAVIAAGITEGFKLLTNSGHDAGQRVMHYHVHVLAGKDMPKIG